MPEENSEENFKPNWLAIFAVVIGLVVIGWLLGRLAAAPDGQTIQCPNEDWIQVAQADNHVTVYCEPPASN